MKNILTSTPKGKNGFNISWNDEQFCGKSLLKKLPDNWKVHFDWFQIMFSDVSYKIDKENKTILIGYCQNLRHWWNKLELEIIEKVCK